MDLADSNPRNTPLNVDILIGADYYWQFVSNNIIRCKDGPIAISSTLGYILSGPIGNFVFPSELTMNISSTHVLKIQSEVINPKVELKKIVNQVWTDENIDSSENAFVIKKFQNEVK